MLNWFKKKRKKPKFVNVFINPTGKKIRNDSFGAGGFGTPRSSNVSARKKHNGVDYEGDAGQDVKAVTSGIISKIGYPYADDLSFRYVEITAEGGYRVRQFYVEPSDGLKKNMAVKKGQVIGTCQALTKKYAGMTNHVHVEIKKDGELVNPEKIIKIGQPWTFNKKITPAPPNCD